MNSEPLLSRAASSYRACASAARTLDKEIDGLATVTVIRGVLLTIPFALYFDFDGLWTHLLAQFNAHAPPLADKVALYIAYLAHARSFHWVTVIFYGALAIDALCLAVRFVHWCMRSSSASPASPQS